MALIASFAVAACAGNDEIVTGSPSVTTASPTTGPVDSSAVSSTVPTTPVAPPTTPAPTAPAVTTTTTVVVTGDSDAGWTPACEERLGEAGHAEAADPRLARFGPLGAAPGLVITAPATKAGRFGSSTIVSVGTIPGGLLVRVGTDFTYESWVVAAVDHDGMVRWRRCFEGSYSGAMVAGTSTVLLSEYAPGPDIEVEWRALDVATGADLTPPEIPPDVHVGAGSSDALLFARREGRIDTAVDRLHLLDTETGEVETILYPDRADDQEAHRVAFALDDDRTLRHLDPSGVTVGVFRDGSWRTDADDILAATDVEAWYDDDAGAWSGRNGLGEIIWVRPELRDPSVEGFRQLDVGDLTLLNTCADRLDDAPCVDPALVALETSTGNILWKLPGLRTVPAAADGSALISDGAVYTDGPFGELGDGYVLVDIDTGEPVGESQRWAGLETFYQGCCGESDYRWVSRVGGVVIVVDGELIDVWYPDDVTSVTIEVSLAD